MSEHRYSRPEGRKLDVKCAWPEGTFDGLRSRAEDLYPGDPAEHPKAIDAMVRLAQEHAAAERARALEQARVACVEAVKARVKEARALAAKASPERLELRASVAVALENALHELQSVEFCRQLAREDEHGEVAERPNAPASKAGSSASGLEGSNPSLSAIPIKLRRRTEGERRAYLEGFKLGQAMRTRIAPELLDDKPEAERGSSTVEHQTKGRPDTRRSDPAVPAPPKCGSFTMAKSGPGDEGKARQCEREAGHEGDHRTTYCGRDLWWSAPPKFPSTPTEDWWTPERAKAFNEWKPAASPPPVPSWCEVCRTVGGHSDDCTVKPEPVVIRYARPELEHAAVLDRAATILETESPGFAAIARGWAAHLRAARAPDREGR